MDNKQRENQPAAESRDQYTHTPDGQGSLEGYEDLVLPPGVSGSNPGFDQSDANVGRRRQNSRIIRNMQTDPLLQRDFSEQKKIPDHRGTDNTGKRKNLLPIAVGGVIVLLALAVFLGAGILRGRIPKGMDRQAQQVSPAQSTDDPVTDLPVDPPEAMTDAEEATAGSSDHQLNDDSSEEEMTADKMLGQGRLYYFGIMVEQDYEEAFRWFKKAAEAGNRDAKSMLGYMYSAGEGVRQNFRESFKWYKEAMEDGVSSVIPNVAYMYEYGIGVEKDYKEAFRLYSEAAELGDASAKCGLANMYFREEGVRLDYDEAFKWYKESAEGGYTDAKVLLGYMYENGYGTEEDIEKALEMYEEAAAEGSSIAKNNLAYLYMEGSKVEQDSEKALKLFKEAADAGNDTAMFNLGYMYENGIGIESDLKKAEEWYRKSSDLGNKEATMALKTRFKE